MPRPPKPAADRLVTVSLRVHPRQRAFLELLAKEIRADLSGAARTLLALGGEAWVRGERSEQGEL